MSTHAGDTFGTPAADQAAFLPPLAATGAGERPATETRPELLVGAAFAGGLVFAKLLRRVRGR